MSANSLRTCVGCGQRVSPQTLLHVVEREGRCVVDPHHREAGRGAWIHPDPQCCDAARRRRAWNRAFKREITDSSALDDFVRQSAPAVCETPDTKAGRKPMGTR